MDITLDVTLLKNAINWANKIAPLRPAVPILSGVVLETNNQGGLVVSVYDYETSAKQVIGPVEIKTPGKVIVQASVLSKVISALNKTRPVHLCQREDGKLVIRSGSGETILSTLPISDYPEVPGTGDCVGTIDAGLFAEAAKRVGYSVSRDDTVPQLATMNLVFTQEHIALEGTDRYRCGIEKLSWSPNSSFTPTSIMVKYSVLSDITGAAPVGTPMNIFVTDGRITFAIGNVALSMKIVDGDYPKVESLFPETESSIIVRTADLQASVKRVGLVVADNEPVKLNFTAEKIFITGGVESTAEDVVPVHAGTAEIAVALNPRYLADGLASLPDEFTKFSFTDNPFRPLIMSGSEKPSEDGESVSEYRYLLMPVRKTQ